MATRYVWGKYAIDAVTQRSITFPQGEGSPYLYIFDSQDVFWSWTYQSGGFYYTIDSTVYGKIGAGYSISNGKFVINNASSFQINENSSNLNFGANFYTATSSSANVYFGLASSSSTTTFDRIYRVAAQASYGTEIRLGITTSNGNTSALIPSTNYGGAGRFTSDSAVARFGIGQGSLTGPVSNSSSSAYPTNGASGTSWYVYSGSDSIDATAVGYSSQSPMGGQPITISVTPTTPTYGGTIQYTYQVQLSGGSWTTIVTKTTSTSQQYTIPAGTTSFAARVVANDTWGFSSSTYTTGTTLTVTNNLPPTAPGSISIGSVVGGQQCTITWTAATDPDGTIASYQLERQTDNGDTWTQIYSGANLTYTDTINADWATVNYRVKATDNDGASGPYATGTMQTVNSGWLYFSGPPSDMGEQEAPFDFVFSIGSTGAAPATNIAVTAIYDDETIYSNTVANNQQITLNIDTRLTYAGTHDIIVTASADGFLAVTQQCDFRVPAVTLPDGGAAGFMEDDAGNTYYPATLARYVIGLKGLDANALFDRVYTGTYTGTGTSGSGNPCSVRTSFEPTLVFIQAAAASTATSGYWVNSAPRQSSQGNMIVNNNGTVTLCPVTWDAEAMTLSWYGTSAAAQLNASGTVYGIIALGGMA